MMIQRVGQGAGVVALACGVVMAQGEKPGAGVVSFDSGSDRGYIAWPPVTLLAWDNGHSADEALVRVRPTDVGYTSVSGGNVVGVGNGWELEYALDGVIYVVDRDFPQWLRKIDPATGQALGSVFLQYPPEGDLITAMEWVAGDLWAAITDVSSRGAATTHLCTIDLDTGVISVVGDTGVVESFGGLTFGSAEGALIAVTTSGPGPATLYALKSTGQAFKLGELTENGEPTPRMTGLEFGPDGHLYAIPNQQSEWNGHIYLINLWTAEAMRLLDTGNRNLVGLTTAPPCVADVAEPFGQLDFSDVLRFLETFGAGCP